MNSRTALVVDDSKSARFALRKALERHGYQVATAESAREADLHLQQHLPEVIFLDHAMPEEDGFTALRRLRAQSLTAHIPIVICSSYDDTGFVEQARSQGAVAVLPKPPTPEALQHVLDALPPPTASPESAVAPAVDVTDDVAPEVAPLDAGADLHPALEAQPESASNTADGEDPASNQRLERAMADLRLHIDAIQSAPVVGEMSSDRELTRLSVRMDELDHRLGAALAAMATAQRQAVEQLQREHVEALESLRRQQTEALEQVRRQAERDLAALHAQLIEQIDIARKQASDDAYARIGAALRDAFPAG